VNRIQTRLKEAEAADEARVRPGEESTVNPAVVADALIVDQWVCDSLIPFRLIPFSFFWNTLKTVFYFSAVSSM